MIRRVGGGGNFSDGMYELAVSATPPCAHLTGKATDRGCTKQTEIQSTTSRPLYYTRSAFMYDVSRYVISHGHVLSLSLQLRVH